MVHSVENGLITIGFLELHPNSINTIPDTVNFKVDLRNPDMDVLLSMEKKLETICEAFSAEHNIEVNTHPQWRSEPIEFRSSDIVKKVVSDLGYSHQYIYSGAGHDACNLSLILPTGMIFIPSVKGISHNESEYSKPEDCEAGANVLLHVLLQQAG